MLPPVCGGGDGSRGPPFPTDPACNWLNLAAELITLPEQPARHLVYNRGDSKADKGGTQYLPHTLASRHQHKEKEFLVDDIGQLERTEAEPKSDTEASAPARWSDLHKAKGVSTGP